MAYTIEIHRHGAGKQPVATLRATDFAYVHSTAGGSNFNVTAKDYLAQHFNSVRVGDWAVVRRSGATAVAFGHVDTVSGGVQVKSGAVVATKPLRVGCSSWFNFLGKSRLYVPLGFSDTVGTSMSVSDWSLAAAAVFTEYATGSIGVALARLHKLIGRVRLPESLGGEFLGDAIPIVHDSETQARWAPQRVIDPVNVANGIMGGLNFAFQDSSIQELYYGSFVPDPRLIEMFPSLEVAPEQADSSQGWAGTGPEYLPLPALARILGVTPVLIYRLRPWRARPLIEAVDALDYDINPDAIADVPLRQQAAPNMSTAAGDQHVVADPALEGAAQLRAIAQGQTRLAESLTWKYRQLNLLGEFQNGKPPLFSEVTWDTRRAIEIPASIIDDIDLNWDDERRVNEVAINLSTDPGTGAEAIRSMGLPLVNEESVINHGTRLAKPVWPFVLPRLGDNNWIPYMRSVACQLMQFQQAAHLMANGTISIRWPDAEVLDESGGQTTLHTQLPALVGEMVSVALEGLDQPLFAYVESVSHRAAVQPATGTETAGAVITFSRGLIGIEDVRKTSVPLAATTKGTAAPQGAAAVPVKRTSRAKIPRTPVTTLLVHDTEVEWGGTHRVVRQLLTKDLSARRWRTPGSLTSMVLHYTDTGVGTTGASGTFEWFQTGDGVTVINGKTHVADSHLVIEADGTLVQFMDLSREAWHANSSINTTSIGVDFVCPKLENRLTDILDIAQGKVHGVRPWQVKTGYRLIGSPTDYVGYMLYTPTFAQLRTAKELAAWAAVNLGLVLSAPASTGNARTVQKGAGYRGPGIYHHAEVDSDNSRSDCLGVFIPEDIL